MFIRNQKSRAVCLTALLPEVHDQRVSLPFYGSDTVERMGSDLKADPRIRAIRILFDHILPLSRSKKRNFASWHQLIGFSELENEAEIFIAIFGMGIVIVDANLIGRHQLMRPDPDIILKRDADMRFELFLERKELELALGFA